MQSQSIQLRGRSAGPKASSRANTAHRLFSRVLLGGRGLDKSGVARKGSRMSFSTRRMLWWRGDGGDASVAMMKYFERRKGPEKCGADPPADRPPPQSIANQPSMCHHEAPKPLQRLRFRDRAGSYSCFSASEPPADRRRLEPVRGASAMRPSRGAVGCRGLIGEDPAHFPGDFRGPPADGDTMLSSRTRTERSNALALRRLGKKARYSWPTGHRGREEAGGVRFTNLSSR